MKTKIWYVAGVRGIEKAIQSQIYYTADEAFDRCMRANSAYDEQEPLVYHVYEAEVTGDRLVK